MQIEVSQETFDVEVNDQLVTASYRTADVERVLLSLLDEAARAVGAYGCFASSGLGVRGRELVALCCWLSSTALL